MGRIVLAVVGIALAACADPLPTASLDQADTSCASVAMIRGIDVSVYETSIDWAAAHSDGIDFAFIRVSDGTQSPDPTFSTYWPAARAAGVLRGAYQYFRPDEDPIAQADLLVDAMGPLAPGDLPPVLDLEVADGLSTTAVTSAAQAWLDHVSQRTGVVPLIYAGEFSWPSLTGSADETSHPLWVPQYTTAACPDIPTPWTEWAFWQDSSTGSVAGIPGSTVDTDVFNGTIEQLRALTVPGSCGDGVCSGSETFASCSVDCAPCGVIDATGGMIDERDACFVGGGPAAYLRHVSGAGEDGGLIWTYATAAASEVSFGQWNLDFAEAGHYRVEAYTAHAYAGSTRADYAIVAAGAESHVVIDQTAVDGWQTLGELAFAAGGGQSVHLADNTGEPSADHAQLVFDAVRLTRLDAPAPPLPTPVVTSDDTGGCNAGGSAGWTGMFLVGLGVAVVTRIRRYPLIGARNIRHDVVDEARRHCVVARGDRRLRAPRLGCTRPAGR